MDLMHERSAGLDVHKDTVVACVRVVEGREVRHEVRTFGATTTPLYELREWLELERVTHVVMEATGVYWKPVWHVLEGGAELVLANAAHVKAVPGRKSDVNDATWLADLLAHGLIRGSFVPPQPIQELRDLTRTRKQLVRERAQHIQRIQKVLQDCNIKLDSVITDIMGLSGRAILRAIISGEVSAEALARLGHHRLKATPHQLAEACRGVVTEHHRFLLALELDEVEHFAASITRLDARAQEHIAPFREAVELVMTAPGFNEVSATALVAEIGTDMSLFPRDANLISWACLCPRSDETAGKRRSTRTRQGAAWVKPLLVQAAWSAVRTKNSYERAFFYRIKARQGTQKAIVAVAASLLQSVYHMLREGVPYRSLGADHFDPVNREATKRRLVKRLETLGYQVQLHEAA